MCRSAGNNWFIGPPPPTGNCLQARRAAWLAVLLLAASLAVPGRAAAAGIDPAGNVPNGSQPTTSSVHPRQEYTGTSYRPTGRRLVMQVRGGG
jgi:hypothetical protein